MPIFLSTSSARRTTIVHWTDAPSTPISIHVLREEDDVHRYGLQVVPAVISIHVLREEDDQATAPT